MESHISNSDVFFDRHSAAKYLHICQTTLDRLNLPKIKVRRKVLFSKAAIEQWLQQHTVNKEAVNE